MEVGVDGPDRQAAFPRTTSSMDVPCIALRAKQGHFSGGEDLAGAAVRALGILGTWGTGLRRDGPL